MKIGDLSISKVYQGAAEVEKIYLGSTVVYEATFSDSLRFKALENSTFGLVSKSSVSSVLYSLDNGNTWTELTTNDNVSLNAGQVALIRGKITGNLSTSNYTKFSITGSVTCKGNIMCLYDYETLPTTIAYDYAFLSLFQDSDVYTADIFNYVSAITGSNCCLSMFKQCNKLIYSPNLPATTLGYACYQEMFKNCTSLTASGSLPAASLTTNCYAWMLQGCTSLTTAPELLATTPTTGSYRGMFYGCSSLNYIKCLATDISASNCVYNWVDGVAASGTFVKNPNTTWPSGTSGIPDNWTVQ